LPFYMVEEAVLTLERALFGLHRAAMMKTFWPRRAAGRGAMSPSRRAPCEQPIAFRTELTPRAPTRLQWRGNDEALDIGSAV
jgi:hypothetical protein